MKWFKCFGPEHPAMSPIIDAYGYEGYGYACAVLNEASIKEVSHLTIEMLCRWLQIRKPKADKLLPLLQVLLTHYRRITKQSESITKQSESITEQSESITEQSESITEQSDRITPVISASNPRGYNPLTEESRLEESKCSSGCLSDRVNEILPPPKSPPSTTVVKAMGAETFVVREATRVYSEEDWLCEHLSMVLRKHKHHFPPETRLQGLLSLYPQHCKTYLEWFRYPIHQRMAAFAFMKTKSHADEEVVYATKVLRGGMSPGSEWDGIPKLLRFFESATQSGDYEIDFTDG